MMEARTRITDDARQPTDVIEHIDLSIGGMQCPHCPPSVERALKSVSGVRAANVNLANRTASVDFDSSRAKVRDLLQAIRSIGYSAGSAKVRIPLKNMHCTTCVTQVELALRMTPASSTRGRTSAPMPWISSTSQKKRRSRLFVRQSSHPGTRWPRRKRRNFQRATAWTRRRLSAKKSITLSCGSSGLPPSCPCR